MFRISVVEREPRAWSYRDMVLSAENNSSAIEFRIMPFSPRSSVAPCESLHFFAA
jgi:hypothetical protein